MRQTLRVSFIIGIFFTSAMVFAEDKIDTAVKKAVAAAVTENASDLAYGRKIYAGNCSVCHGDKGVGSKWTLNTLNPSPRDFTSPSAVIELTRDRMLQAVIAGREGTAMVSYLNDLSVSDVISVVDFIRSEFMQPEQKKQSYIHGAQQLVNMQLPFATELVGNVVAGRDLYLGNCAACHGVNGDGEGVRKSASQPLPRNFLTVESRQILNRPTLYKGTAEGKNGTVMPAWKRVFSEQQIADVAEYVFQTFIYPVEALADNTKKKVTKY